MYAEHKALVTGQEGYYSNSPELQTVLPQVSATPSRHIALSLALGLATMPRITSLQRFVQVGLQMNEDIGVVDEAELMLWCGYWPTSLPGASPPFSLVCKGTRHTAYFTRGKPH